jgi:hypothetical protein
VDDEPVGEDVGTNCDGCGDSMVTGWMVPTGRTLALELGGPEYPVCEFFCNPCYAKRGAVQ